VNMLQTTFTENGAATFNWLPSNSPEVYGYGIELERAITGYDRHKQGKRTADTKIILLPPSEDGSPVEMLVDGTPVEFGTLATSLTNEEEAATRFGVAPRSIRTDISQVTFPNINNAFINLSEYKAVYFDQLSGSAYTMQMENGFHHIKMTWFDENARMATYNYSELLAPQIHASTSEPIDISQVDTYYMPLYKEREISAGEIFVDLGGNYSYYWFIDPDNNQLSPEVGNTLLIPPQSSLKQFKVKLVATQNIEDESFEKFEKIFNVEVYVPEINLNEDELKEGIIAGNMTAIEEDPAGNLSEIPFSVFRKRQGAWKNIGLLRHQDPTKSSTKPPLNDVGGKKYEYTDSYYSVDTAGSYQIEGFEVIDPSPIIFKDHEGNLVAEVLPGTGQIILHDPNFELKAVPASEGVPTHLAIVKKETGEIIGNVYYMAEPNTDVEIANSALNQNNVNAIGVTVGDANPGDDIIAANIPGYGPSFPGGSKMILVCLPCLCRS